ncbi:MAG TPA: hypothetical protein PLF40_31495, partial [Kofleriaceae bacterium]|nr:hypothetical protein [Kofleriaceae bacterium]
MSNTRLGALSACVLALASTACKSKKAAAPVEPVEHVERAAPAKLDAAARTADAAPARNWTTDLGDLPWISATRLIKVPVHADQPRFDVVGPVVVGDLAVVGSSQFGFAAIRWSDGSTAWTKPTGLHLAPPLVLDDNVLLIADCAKAPVIDESQVLLGCLRTVSGTGNDLSLAAIVAPPELAEAFAGTTGPSRVWAIAPTKIAWQRGDVTLEFDPLAPRAKRSAATAPSITATINKVALTFKQTDEAVLALDDKGKEQWRVGGRFAAVLGIVQGA